MGGKGDSERPGRRRVDEEAKALFLEGIRAGRPRDEAAAAAGFTASAFYYARERDPIFRRAWAWAHELSAIDERAAAALAAIEAAPADEVAIVPNANRMLQRCPVRRRRFDERRRRIFLDHFAGTADAHAAATAAGVGYATVMQHWRKDPDFGPRCDEALAIAYAQLEAEALRQRLEAQQRLRDGLVPVGEIAREFDRVIQLLDRYRRRDGRVGLREVGRGHERRRSFDEAILELDRALRGLGLRHGRESEPIALPAPDAGGAD